MKNSELFDVLKEQLFDRLVAFDERKKTLFSSFSEPTKAGLGKSWLSFAEQCAISLNQIATASRLERYEYQETLSDNIKSLQSHPQALDVLTHSRDQSILIEFFARSLSLVYYETILEGVFSGIKDSAIIDAYVLQSQELSELLLFSLGKEFLFEEKYLKIMTTMARVNLCSNISQQLQKYNKRTTKKKDLFLERQIKTLRNMGTLYKDSFIQILDATKEDFWWDDHVLRHFIYSKAESYFLQARELLVKNPLDPSLLMRIDFDIAHCNSQKNSALGLYYIDMATNILVRGEIQKSTDYFNAARDFFVQSLEGLESIGKDYLSEVLLIEAKTYIDFTEVFLNLLELSGALSEIATTDLSKKELIEKIALLAGMIENPKAKIDYYSQLEFLSIVGFIVENLQNVLKYEDLSVDEIKDEIIRGFKRLGKLITGRIDSKSRQFLELPWNQDQEDLEVKQAFCENEGSKLQDIIITVLLIPTFVPSRAELLSKSKAVHNILLGESSLLKGGMESNATKALCLLVKGYIASKESFDNLEKGKVIEELQVFVKEEFSRTFIRSHLKEAAILQNGNQYFFARYLLRNLPDILRIPDFDLVPKEIASLLIESHGAMFDSMISIWDRLTSLYSTMLQHNQKYPVSTKGIVNWSYIEKKKYHTQGAMQFFQSCQAVIQAQEYALIKDRVKSEKLFRKASKHAQEAAAMFNSVLDTLKGEVLDLPKDLFNFSNFCKVQGQKVSQGKKIDDLPIKDFVVLIGIISSSL